MATYAEVEREDKWHDCSFVGAFPLFGFVLLDCFELLRFFPTQGWHVKIISVCVTTKKFIALASMIAIDKILVTVMGFSEIDPIYKILANM